MTSEPRFGTVSKMAEESYTAEFEKQLDGHVEKIIKDRDDIIELFVKTFLSVHEAPTKESLKALFSLVELECKMHGDFHQTFRIKMREK